MVRFGGTADAFNCTASLRNSRAGCWPSDVLDLWNSRFVPFLLNKRQILLCDVVLLRHKVLLPSVEVDQFLVQRLMEQLEIQTSLDIVEVPETNPVRCRCSPAYV